MLLRHTNVGPRRTSNLLFSGLVLGGIILLQGCASLSDFHYEKSQKMRAWHEYKECGNPGCSKFPHDYKKGWKDGFYEVVTGGPCCPPAVAPACYWNPKQILDNCDNRRHAYYSGWQDGAARASQYPDTHFLRIYESCECPFPRCDCQECGQSCGGESCGCNAGSFETSVTDGGMVYDPGVIEADREIMMMPIPETPVEELSQPALLPEPEPAEELNEADAAPTQDIAPVPDEPSDDSAPPMPAAPQLDQVEAPSPDSLAPPAPVAEEPESSSDTVPQLEDLPEPETLPVPAAPNVDPISVRLPSSDETADESVKAPYTYQFAPDNSQVIDFDALETNEPVATVLSDFDVQLDGVGLIE